MTPSDPIVMPPEVAATARAMAADIRSLAARMRDAILAQQSAYTEIGLVPLDDLTRSCEDHLEYVLGELGGTPRDTRSATAVGRRRAEQGVPLDAMLQAYRVGARFITTQLLEGGATSLLRSDLVLETVQGAWEMLEDYSQAVTTAYLETVGERTRRSAEARSATLAALLAGHVEGGPRLAEAAALLEIGVDAEYVAVAVQVGESRGRDLSERLSTTPLATVWHRGLDLHLGLVAVPRRGGLDAVLKRVSAHEGERVGVSALTTGLDRAPGAAREARLAAACAVPGSVVRHDDVPVPVLLAGHPEGADRLVQAVLGGVLALPARERETLLETLRTWFEHGGSVTDTAAALYVHRNTIGHRAQQVATLTGRSLSDPANAAELFVALEAHRLAGLRRTDPSQVTPS